MWRRKRKIQFYNEKIIIVVLAILMCCQIAFTAYETHQQYLIQKKSVATIAMQKQAANDERAYSTILNLAATVYSDSEVLAFLEREENTFEERSKLGYLLRRYATVTGEVSNVYLYSGRQNVLYDMYMQRYRADDENFSGLFAELEQVPEMRKKEFLYRENNTVDRLCYLFSPDKASQNAVIVEPMTEMFSRYSETQAESGGALIVARGDGTVLYGGGEFSFGSSISEELFFRQKNVEAQWYIGNYNDKKFVYNYFSSDSLDRWYISMIADKNIMSKQIFSIQFVYLYIGLLITLLTLLRVSAWLRRVREKLEVRKLESERRLEEDEQKYLFRNMLLDYAHESKSETELKKMEAILTPGFPMDKKFGILFVKLNRYDAFKRSNKPSVVELYRYGMKNIITELLQNAGFAVFDLSGRENYLEFLIGNYSKALTDTELRVVCRESYSAIMSYIELPTSYLYSQSVPFTEIDRAFRQAEKIRSFSLLYEEGAILGAEVIKESDEKAFNEANALSRELENVLLRGAVQELEWFDEFYQKLYSMNAQQAKESLWRLMFVLNGIEEQLLHQEGLLPDYGDNIMTKLEKADSMVEIRSIVEHYFEKFTTHRKNHSNDRLQMLVNTCCDMIEREYHDENLSIEIIAERVGLSVNYLGRKFRQTTGVSITDRILKKRLSVAEKLLVETDTEISQVMRLSGFPNNASYFTKLFKKHYGMTPSQYRQANRN